MISIYCPSHEWDEFNESVEWEDGVAYVKAKKEFEKNPKTYTLDEIEAELKMDGGEE